MSQTDKGPLLHIHAEAANKAVSTQEDWENKLVSRPRVKEEIILVMLRVSQLFNRQITKDKTLEK